MESQISKKNLALRKNRIRSTVKGSTARPRLTVSVSNRHIQAQIINDANGKTLVASSTVGRKATGNLSEQAGWVGTDIAKKATKAGIKQVVLDRNGKLYHGRVAALADAARKEGLDF